MATAQSAYNTKEADFSEKSFDDDKNDNFENHVKPWKQGKYRDFLLTLNCEIDEDIDKSKIELLKKFNNLKKYLLSLKYTYILASLEKNKRDYYHIHIFIQFDTPHKLSIKKLEGANIRIINKTINKVLDYVKKDGVILNEFGYPRYITGNPSIKDIALSKISDINENSNAKFYRIYKEIKQDNQGLFNTRKKVYILSSIPINEDTKYNKFSYLQINEKGKIKKWPTFMILKNKQVNINNIDNLLNLHNEPIQYKYYPADIEEIMFIIPNDIKPEYKELINRIYDYYSKNGTISELINEFKQGELDSEEFYDDEGFPIEDV